jgi:hypothetical protein
MIVKNNIKGIEVHIISSPYHQRCISLVHKKPLHVLMKTTSFHSTWTHLSPHDFVYFGRVSMFPLKETSFMIYTSTRSAIYAT